MKISLSFSVVVGGREQRRNAQKADEKSHMRVVSRLPSLFLNDQPVLITARCCWSFGDFGLAISESSVMRDALRRWDAACKVGKCHRPTANQKTQHCRGCFGLNLV